ncbi:MAG: hypothetical protein ACKVOU_12370 [Cytophagales bacterium]
MKNKLLLIIPILIAFAFSCSETKEEPKPTSSLSTNPADCKLSKITFSDGFSPFDYKYNADGNVSEITNGSTVHTFTYSNGLLSNQKNSSLELRYTYTGTVLSNIEFLDGTGAKLGDYVVTMTPAGQISTLTVANPNAVYNSFNGVVTTFTYDASGNNTLIEVKNGDNLIAKTEYSNFVSVRSHIVTNKGMILPTSTSPVTLLDYSPFLKYPNTTPNAIKRSTILDSNLQPTATLTVVEDFTYERIANESGLQKERKVLTGGSGSAFYEYTGCK